MFMVIKCYFKSCMRANPLNSPSKAFSCYTLSCSSPACPSIHLQAQPFCSLPLTSAHIFPPTSLFLPLSVACSLSFKSIPNLPPPDNLSYPLPCGLRLLSCKRGGSNNIHLTGMLHQEVKL